MCRSVLMMTMVKVIVIEIQWVTCDEGMKGVWRWKLPDPSGPMCPPCLPKKLCSKNSQFSDSDSDWFWHVMYHNKQKESIFCNWYYDGWGEYQVNLNFPSVWWIWSALTWNSEWELFGAKFWFKGGVCESRPICGSKMWTHQPLRALSAPPASPVCTWIRSATLIMTWGGWSTHSWIVLQATAGCHWQRHVTYVTHVTRMTWHT